MGTLRGFSMAVIRFRVPVGDMEGVFILAVRVWGWDVEGYCWDKRLLKFRVWG